MQELIDKLKLVDDKLDAEGFNSEGPARKTIAEVSLFLQQLLNKTACSTPLEVLAQLLKEEYKLAEDKTLPFFKSGMHYANTSSIEDVMKLLKERPPMA